MCAWWSTYRRCAAVCCVQSLVAPSLRQRKQLNKCMLELQTPGLRKHWQCWYSARWMGGCFAFCRYVVVITTILYVSGSIWHFTRNPVILTKFSIGPISSSKSQILIIFILWLLLWVCGRCKRKNHSRSTLLNWIAISNSGNLPDWGSWKCPASLSVWSGVVKNMKYQSLLRQTRWKH